MIRDDDEEVSRVSNVDRFMAWAEMYSAEEPALKNICRIEKKNFPNICLAFPSGDGAFPVGFMLICDHKLPKGADKVMEGMAENCLFTVCTNDWTAARDITLEYLKHQPGPGDPYPDPRYLPEDISLN